MNETAPPDAAALIYGGTAAYWLDLTEFGRVVETRTLDTPYGPAAPIDWLALPGGAVVGFSSRHGVGTLQRSAGFVNHRANLWAAHRLGFRAILSWNGVGAINPALTVGDLVVPDELIDWTGGRRAGTFERWRQPPAGPTFDPGLRAAIWQALETVDHSAGRAVPGGVYVCTEGPRLETAAEIALLAAAGADVVGMTLAPEVWLARELGLRYASLCYITNYATGRARGRAPRREFGPAVGQLCMAVLVAAVRL